MRKRSLLALGVLSLALALPIAQAEVITRVMPDGSVRYTVVHGVPSVLDTEGQKYPPTPEAIAAAKELARTGKAPVITMQRHEDGRHSVSMPALPSRAGSALPGTSTLPDSETERAAQQAYAESLARVQQDPACTECRIEALALGRRARSIGRPDGRPTIYDEAAIANDLNAVSGGAAK